MAKNEVIDNGINETGFVLGAVPEIVGTQDKNAPVVNLRVQRFYLLSADVIEWDEKDKKGNKTGVHRKALTMTLLDSVGFKPETNQPILENKNCIVSGFLDSPTAELESLTRKPVFSEVVFKISGNDRFTNFHGLLSEDEAAIYKKLLGI